MKNLLILFGLMFSLVGWSQQQALFTQYMYNDLIFNPGVTGAKDYVPINLNSRRQWVGIEDAPFTQTISAHSYLGQNFGVGGVVFNQVTGPTRRTGMTFSSSYHLTFGKDRYRRYRAESKTLSLGLGFTLSQFVADKDKLKTRLPDDPAVDNAFNYQLIPDVSFGAYYHDGNNFYAGFSVLNMAQTNSDLYQSNPGVENKVVRTYYLMGGGNIEFNDHWSVQPSGIIQMIEATPFQAEVTGRVFYDKSFYVGAGYRYLDAVSGLLGYKNDNFLVGYSYDYTLSDLQGYNSGSHEINVMLFLMKKTTQRGRKSRRGKKAGNAPRDNYNPDIQDF